MAKPFEVQDPDYRDFVAHQFKQALFIQHLGVELTDFGPGWCETALIARPEFVQQDGLFHAGIVATLADHTAGMASGTLCPKGKKVLTVEYKINLLRPGTGKSLRCRADVVRPGKRLTVVHAEVYAKHESDERLIATMTATMALV